MAFDPGHRIGDYEILSMLGAGGMGQVYRVRNVISDRVEAMKVLLPDFAAEPELAARFIAEIRTLASLDHPNIAQLHTAFQADNQLVMMMEFVEGFTLEQRAKQGMIPQSDVIEYALQILDALSYAHARGVVHRDIKPANAMVTPHGIVKLMDFGIARSRTETQLTQPGTTLGSLYYMSPEQVRGSTVDFRSDLYSLGIVLYELLAGRRPFEADTTYSILNQQLTALPTPPIEVNPLLPKALNDLILFSLAKDPAQRFQSAGAFRNALCAVAGRSAAATATATRAPAPAASLPSLSPEPFSPTSAAAAAPSYGPLPPPPNPVATPARVSSGSQRALWVGIGAVGVVALLIAAAVGLPHFLRTGAASRGATPATQSAPAQAVQSAPAAQSAPSSAAPPSQPQSSAPAPAAAPSAATVSASSPSPTPRQSAARIASRPAPATHAPPVPVSQPSAPPIAASQAAAPPATPAGPSQQEIDQALDRKVQLDARASAVAASLDNLRRRQEASGYSLRQDIAAAAIRMRSFLDVAAADLNNGDIAAAQRDMDKAEKEISTLESFFNR